MLKSPTTNVWESKSLYKSYVSCIGCVPIQDRQLFLLHWSFYSFDLCCFKIHSIRGENCNLYFLFIYLFLLSIWLTNLSPSLCFDSLCILPCKMGLDAAYRWVLAFYPICLSVSWLGHLVHLNLGLILIYMSLILSFNAGWLLCPLVDVNSSLWWYSLRFDMFLEWLILVIPFYV